MILSHVEFQKNFTAPDNIERIVGFGDVQYNFEGNAEDNYLRGGSLNDTYTGQAGSDTYLIYLGMGSDTVTDFNLSEGDNVQLAYGLEHYDYSVTLEGAVYNLSDGSSLNLIYDFIA